MSDAVRSTRVSRHVNAPRTMVYEALLDADATASWKLPDGMTCQVHGFEGRVGGTFRISLTYDTPSETAMATRSPDCAHALPGAATFGYRGARDRLYIGL